MNQGDRRAEEPPSPPGKGREERVHAGEFMRLIAILTGDEDKFLAKGKKEVDEMAGEK